MDKNTLQNKIVNFGIIKTKYIEKINKKSWTYSCVQMM